MQGLETWLALTPTPRLAKAAKAALASMVLELALHRALRRMAGLKKKKMMMN